MKIAYLVSDFGAISETFITDLAVGLTEIGHQITIVCNRYIETAATAKVTAIEETPFLIFDSFRDRIGFRVDRLLDKYGQVRTYSRHLRQAHHCLSSALNKHKPEFAYIDYGTVAALARQALQAQGIPFVVHFHGADITSALNNVAYQAELQNVFQDAVALIVASNHMRRLLVLAGAPADKIHIVRLGIDLVGLTPKPWSERRNSPPSVVFLGRFTPKKHPLALVEAFALVKQQIPTAQMSMIGDGPEWKRAKQRIDRLKLADSVTLYGALPHEQALPILNQHWVYAQHSVTAPSGDQEGFGISLAEAAALELPVVSTLHNGIPEQVCDGQTGFLVREFDYEAMADRIIQLLQNPGLAEQMGQIGRDNIAQLCRMEERVTKISTILSKVCPT